MSRSTSLALAALGAAALALPTSALATGIDEACQHLEGQKPSDYDEQQQQDFLSNYYAIVSSFSAVHGPVPHEAGHGMIGVRLGGMPPLPCRRRFALDWSKTEDTNKAPAIPTIHASYAFQQVAGITPYAEAGFLAPVPVSGTRNLVFQAAVGAGGNVSEKVQLGLRAHAAVQRTVGDIATPIEEGDPIYDDLYLGSTLGIQGLFGLQLGPVNPFAMVGFMDASTFFYVGDSSVVTNNLHPYLGPEYALGVEGLVKERFRWGAEYYAAPGGHRTLGDASSLDGFAAYGRLHTLRIRLGVEL